MADFWKSFSLDMTLRVEPRWDVIRAHYHFCGRLWDGYRFPPTGDININTTIHHRLPAGYEFDIFMVPLYGINGYYELNETVNVADSETETVTSRNVILWCHDWYPAMAQYYGRSGSPVTFRAMPHTVAQFVGQLASSKLLSPFVFLPANFITLVDVVFQTGAMVNDHAILGELLTRKIQVRRNFAFLTTFTPASWTAICVTLVALSLVTALVSVITVNHVLHLTRQRLKVKRFTLSGGLNHFVRIVMDFIGLLLGRGQERCDEHLYNWWLLSVWLLAVTVLGGCLSGSLRDLMASAVQTIVAVTWEDLYLPSELAHYYLNHTILAISFEPTYEHFIAMYESFPIGSKPQIIRSSPSREWFYHPVDVLRQWAEAFFDLAHFVILISETAFLAILWEISTAPHELVAIVAWLFRSHGDPQYRTTPEDRLWAEEKVTSLVDDFYENLYLSPGRESFHHYSIVSKQVSRRTYRAYSGFLAEMHDYGYRTVFDKYFENMQTRFMTQVRSGAACQQIIVEDFIGPGFLYAATLMLACLAANVEQATHRLVKRKQQTRVRPVQSYRLTKVTTTIMAVSGVEVGPKRYVRETDSTYRRIRCKQCSVK